MGHNMYRWLLKFTSGTVLLAIAAPLVLLTILAEAAQASLDHPAPQTLLAEMPSESLLKDDDDDDDDNDDDDEEEGSRRQTTTTTTTTTTTRVSYTDVTTNYWASQFIYRLASIDVVSGFPDGEFLPGNFLTRAQYAAMMVKAFDVTPVREVVSIRNVSQYYWAYSALQKAYAAGFIDLNDDNTLNPEASMTKLEFLVMLARTLGYTEVTSSQSVTELLSIFTDADTIPSQYRVIIAALVERGILVNYPNVRALNLFEQVTRAEACAYLYQTLVSLNRVESVDSNYIVDITEITTTTETTTDTDVIDDDDDDNDDNNDDDNDDDDDRQSCNQGIGNGPEGCDPGNSSPRGGSNDETGRTPGGS